MEQEVKINAKEIMIKLARLQADVDYIKEHIGDIELFEEDLEVRKKKISENYKKSGSITDEEWEFCEKIDWHPVDELPPKPEHVKELKKALKETSGKKYASAEEFFDELESAK